MDTPDTNAFTKPIRAKKYKALSPYDTIELARTAIKKCDIFICESCSYSSVSRTFSNTLRFGDEDIIHLNIGAVNGKGLTPRYSLASAYGELMERVQNLCIRPIANPGKFLYSGSHSSKDPHLAEFLSAHNISAQFIYTPDEKWFSAEEAFERSKNVLTEMRAYKGLTENQLFEVYMDFSTNGYLACVPFYNLTKSRKEYLPYKIIRANTGSNGMSAGNTYYEAIIQGLSEIYERDAQYRIVTENMPVPAVPDFLFEGTAVYSLLQNLKNKGIRYDILDFSCGMNLPVLGLRLIDRDGSISIRPGADPSPITALERCLTETFQASGSAAFRFSKEALNPPLPTDTDDVRAVFQRNFKSMVSDGSGAWPDNVHCNKRFTGFQGFANSISTSDLLDYEFMVGVAEKQGRKIYIRDNSFLGFHTYLTFIPGMSDLPLFCFEREKAIKLPDMTDEILTLLSLSTASIEELQKLKSFLEHESHRKYTTLELSSCYPPGILSSLPSIATDMPKLLKAIDMQIKALQGSGALVFTQKNWPICFQCESCAYQRECRYVAVAKRLRALYKQYEMNTPQQNVCMSY